MPIGLLVSLISFDVLQIPAASRLPLSATALSDHIVDIVGLSSGKKVGWIDAWRIVARVKNLECIGNIAKGKLIGNPMRKSVSVRDTTRTDQAIPIIVCSADPDNATAISPWTYVLSKTCRQWDCLPNALATL